LPLGYYYIRGNNCQADMPDIPHKNHEAKRPLPLIDEAA